jgi:hypothetical protein
MLRTIEFMEAVLWQFLDSSWREFYGEDIAVGL